MIHRSQISLVLAVIIIATLSYFYFKFPKEDVKNIQSNIVLVDVATSTKYSIATGEYPQFTNASDEFNGSITDVINQGIQDHAMNSEDNWRARFETAPQSDNVTEFPKDGEKFEYTIASTTVVRNDSRVISLVIYVYEFSGGAHGQEAILTFNYDVINKKDITIEDYLDKDVNFLKKLSTLARTLLVDEMVKLRDIQPEAINMSMLNDGTTPVKGNFSLFTIPSDSKLVFYFTQYQVAPYVFGSFEIPVDVPLQ